MKSRTAKIMLAATLTSVGLSIAVASPASAAPRYCTASPEGNGAKAYCYASASGTQYRAVARCKYQTPTGSWDYSNFYSGWERQGDPGNATVQCGLGWTFLEPNAQVR
ncbi:hypothetical protein P3102_15770 [Amycolatopsis sp. QT-25]|uniref:hypothetical protein n=1 Tax=Amycolatopsis sp. QT-25 TaxID=3034022 RepID=UPI0023EDAE8B|nr:hypothetical protein [Amycolatopsis sp. QT-25]WET82555.1 hypothetical protein P3102_15770 [Amycolatopsis sp. QT-25]